MASRPRTAPRAAPSGNLRMVWSFAAAIRARSPRAALALLVAAAATAGVPYAFKLIIDKGFARRRAATSATSPAGSNIC